MIEYVVMFHEWEIFPNKKIRRHYRVAYCTNKEDAINNIIEYKKKGILDRIYCFKNGDRFSIRKVSFKHLYA